jgi:outer membrane protein assembly factor BamB
VAREPEDAVVQYPGAIRARFRWAGSGGGPSVFALSETGGSLVDLGPHVAADPDVLCRAEVRVESPVATWTVRLASAIHDRPAAVLWDTEGLLVVKYGFHTYGFDARTGAERWEHRSRTPILAVLASSRLDHVLVQTELETFALEADGTVAWRASHSDVVAAVELISGRLVLTSYDGLLIALDPATGRSLP